MEPIVTLPPVVDLPAAEALLDTLRQAHEQGRAGALDAALVAELTLPGMQVILSAVRTNPGFTVTNPSPVFAAAFEGAALSWICDGADTPAAAAVEMSPPSEPQPDAAVAADAGAPIEPPIEAGDEAPTEPATATAEPRSVAKRILTIDDSKTMRDMLRLTLAGAGFDVLQAVDGQDGLDVLRKERIDVVITDINMPKLDGYGVIRHLRADASYDDTPILVLSTEGDQKTKEIGRDAGATGWLVKPFDPDQLVEIVRQVSP
jgi:two-component system, chemotaxis family, chemotaxis protein CheY